MICISSIYFSNKSQHDSGCLDNGVVPPEDNIIYEAGCPFTKEGSEYSPCDFCYGEFIAGTRSLSADCVEAITRHCKLYYKEDEEACLDFPEFVIGGDCDYDKVPTSAFNAMELAIREGRGGKGTIFTFAAGNSFTEGDDVNFSGWTNARYTISVGAVGKDGLHAEYSSPGAALLVSAPAGDNKDIGHLMTAALGVDQCQSSGLGTSFACPVVTGVVALMLEANPDLSWRDVQGILASTSTSVLTDPLDDTDIVNGAGLWHSNWYGFGIVNAKAAVEAAMGWGLYSEELQAIGISAEENKEITDSDGNEFTSTINMNPSDDNYPDDFVAESTVVMIDLSHYNRGDLEIVLESPAGTRSVLHPGRRPENSQLNAEERWKLMTVKNWGESVDGNWKLTIRDLVDRENSTDQNIFRNWQLVVYGRSSTGQDGFGVGNNDNNVDDEGTPKSEACLNPDAPTPGCDLDMNGDQVCPISFTLTAGNDQITLDSKIICPNDVVSSGEMDTAEATQRGLCSCDAATFDGNCDVIEPDLQCQCYECPAGGMAYSCNKPIIGDCLVLDCNGECNGEFEFPLPASDKPTFAPTMRPTNSPTASPTRNPTASPTNSPTSSPTMAPTTFAEAFEKRNLSCKNAVPISSSTPRVEAAISPLPLLGFDGTCVSGLETVGGWYQVEGDGAVVTLTACTVESNKNVQISVFDGSCDSAKCIEDQTLQVAPCGDGNGHATSFATEQGKTYFVLVSGIPIGAPLLSSFDALASDKEIRRLESTEEIDFRLEMTQKAKPKNGRCEAAKSTNFNSGIKGDTAGLVETYRTCQGDDKPGAWYTVQGTESNELDGVIVYEANTCNQESNFYNTMSVYRGDNCNKLECVDYDVRPCPSGWFGQQVYWSSTIKEEYRVFVHSADTIEAETFSAGSFQIDLRYDNRMGNDQCNAALNVEVNRIEPVKSSTTGARPDITAIERSSCGTGSAGAWYKARGTGGIMQASTCSDETDHKTAIQVFSGECGKLRCIDFAAGNKALCENGRGSVVNFRTTLGQDYYILVSSRREGQTGDFRLTVTEEDAVTNDQCRRAPALEKGVSVEGSNLLATIDFPPEESCVVPLDSPGVWYTIEGAGKAIEVGTCQDNNFDAAISVFKGSCPNSLECVAGSSAVDSSCTNGKGVSTSFYGESSQKYLVYVHGATGSPNYQGDFSLTYNEFEVTDAHEFCAGARDIPTDGSRVQGSTEDATGAAIPESSCGVDITQPGLWYTFKGNAQPFEITACSEDEGDFDVSVSIFEGGPGGCAALTCVTGTTFVATCGSAQGRRSLKQLSTDFRFMSKPGADYFVFVHGTDVGDFSLFVQDENVAGFGTAAPTPTPVRHGKDLFRWLPINSKTTVIPTDYLELEVVSGPSQGNLTIAGYQIEYTPTQDFVGDEVITLDGCNNGDCYRFDVTIHVMGKKPDPISQSKGSNKGLLWLLVLLVVIPLMCLPFYLFFRKKGKDEDDLMSDDGISDFDHDPFSRDDLLPDGYSDSRGMTSSNDDWESSDDDDEDFEGSSEEESGSDDESEENSASMQSSDFEFSTDAGFNDEFNGSSGYPRY